MQRLRRRSSFNSGSSSTLRPERAVELHDQLFGMGYAAPANRSNTTAYRMAYRLLGFAAAERLKAGLRTFRTIPAGPVDPSS